MDEHELQLGYDARFGELVIRTKGPDGDEHRWDVHISHLIRACGITPAQLRAYMLVAHDPSLQPSGVAIDPLRKKVLDETDWKDKVVLDVGGYDGWAAGVALMGGAKSAVCLDSLQYEHYGWAENKLPGVIYQTGDALEWECPVDVVIAYNVLYHVKNPWQFLSHMRAVCKGEMLLCTLFRYSDEPTWHLYMPRECNPSDETVFWVPSILGLERLLKLTGWDFKREGLAMDRVIYRCTPAPGFVETHGAT